MRFSISSTLAVATLTANAVIAQDALSPAEALAAAEAATAVPAPPAPPAPDEVPAPPAGEEPVAPAPAEGEEPVAPAPAEPVAPALPGEEGKEGEKAEGEKAETEKLENGTQLTNADLNNVFLFLARQAELSYFHNPKIAGPDFQVNGFLRDGDPLQQMNDLAFQYGLTLYRKGDTAYALTPDQLNQLPANEFHYQLNYLRPKDIEQIKSLVAPMLSPGTGIVNYEPKTNTVVVIDTPNRIERIKSFLERVDRAKGQVVVEVKVYRVNSTIAQSLGVNWASTVGVNGNLALTTGIGGLLGLQSTLGASSPITRDLVFTPNEISGTLKALNEANVTKLENNPVLITEDNEPASITIIDRIPIITTTTNQGTSTASVSEEVRYKIDESDSVDPETTREIGTTIFVTPTILPDGTIRLAMRPRTAQKVDEIKSETTSNIYPVVRESTVSTIARIPDGHSLIVGGFFQEEVSKDKNKVPLLGDIPVINFLFKNKADTKTTSSLIFVVTPSTYRPEDHDSHHRLHNRLSSNMTLPADHEELDPKQPGAKLHEPNLNRTLHNAANEATYQQGHKPAATYRQPAPERRYQLRR